MRIFVLSGQAGPFPVRSFGCERQAQAKSSGRVVSPLQLA
jgi:hypothetical protein